MTKKRLRLDNFCTFSSGGKTKVNKGHYVASGYPAFSAAGQDGFVSEYEYDRPAVVVSSIGTCGNAFLASGKWTSLANTYLVFPDVRRVLPEYLWYILNDPNSWIISGTATPFINPADIKARTVTLVPLEEQRQIVNVLNRTNRILHLQTQVSVCLRDFSSALFSRLFGERRDYPKRWQIAALDEVATVRAGNPAPQDTGAFCSTGPLFVRMQDVGRDHVNPALSVSRDRISPDWLQRNRLRLFPAGSILIPKSGASVNLNHRAMLAVDAHVVSHLAVVIPDLSKIDPHYLFWWSVGYEPQVPAAHFPSLKLATLKAATLPLPPLDDQRRFARVAKRALHITQNVEAAARTTAILRESLMARLLGDAV